MYLMSLYLSDVCLMSFLNLLRLILFSYQKLPASYKDIQLFSYLVQMKCCYDQRIECQLNNWPMANDCFGVPWEDMFLFDPKIWVKATPLQWSSRLPQRAQLGDKSPYYTYAWMQYWVGGKCGQTRHVKRQMDRCW